MTTTFDFLLKIFGFQVFYRLLGSRSDGNESHFEKGVDALLVGHGLGDRDHFLTLADFRLWQNVVLQADSTMVYDAFGSEQSRAELPGESIPEEYDCEGYNAEESGF